MARKKQEESLEESVVENPQPNFTSVALGLHKSLSDNNLYEVVEIPYDPITGISGTPKVLHKDVFEDSADRFKITAAEKLLTRSNG